MGSVLLPVLVLQLVLRPMLPRKLYQILLLGLLHVVLALRLALHHQLLRLLLGRRVLRLGRSPEACR